MKVQLLRNATLLLTINDKTLLVDPLLGSKGSYDPLPDCASTARNPLVDLPVSANEVIAQTDAVLLTHLHTDHWDATARELLPKDIPLFCQPTDAAIIRQAGFSNLTAVESTCHWEGIEIARTGGRHGVGEIGQQMGAVSGYVLSFAGETIYIAGDTIWCTEVQEALDRFKPSKVIVNGSAAQFITGGPILMPVAEVITLCRYAPQADVYIVHLEAVNISTETRATTRQAIAAAGLNDRCFIPADGEVLFR
jgi:L-ascorbate metabolism protein UlaG (beta-lactamase superfamily)